jgi:GNAT superfamily N-acetyltransferase
MRSANDPWIAGPEDAPAVARLLCEFRDWWGSREPSDDEMLAGVRRIMAGGDGVYLLAATAGAAPAGVAQLRFRWSVWKGAEDCWLEDLYVRDAARRAGLGRALVGAAVRQARERGCRRIELDVNEDNAVARALYAACGFDFEPKPPGRTLFIARRLG